jgi:PAS domain S-box-containing protein
MTGQKRPLVLSFPALVETDPGGSPSIDRLEQQLRDRDALLTMAEESAGIGIWDIDPAAETVRGTPQFWRIYGLPPSDEALPLEVTRRLRMPEDRERVARGFRTVVGNHATSFEIEYRIKRPDGMIRWLFGRGRLVRDALGRPVRYSGIDIDVTERKEAEAELRALTETLETRIGERTRELAELNERLRRERLLFELIIENTSEGIIVVDNELRHLIWNAAMESINGQRREDVLGKTVFEVFPQFSDHPVGNAWCAALKGERAKIRDYRFFSEPRGAEIIYDADFTPLYGQNRAIIGAIGILRDTTERHRIERLSKLETVARLTGGVAHDFNNLLTAAMGWLEMILHDEGDRRLASFAETALRAINRGAQLTQQLLAFSRRQALRPVSADLNQLVAEIEVLIRRAVGETIDVVIEDAAALPRCTVDPAQFESAVMNLVINARDAMPAGGRVRLVTRKIARHEIPTDVDLSPGDYVAFTVEDNGEGMPPEVAARVLEPFYTTKEIGKGSGLGLSTVYGFATQSGGGLGIDSAPGQGTTVTLYLPVASDDPEESTPGRAVDEREPGTGSILVVEDDADVQEISVAILEELGYRTLVADNSWEALEILRRSDAIDLLFTDLVMPGGMSGAVLAREAQAIRPRLRVLLTTGYAGPDASSAAAEFPMISKPFRSVELSHAIARLMAERSEPLMASS